MSLEYISNYYSVPAKKGQRISYKPNTNGLAREGKIVGASGQYLKIRFDADAKPFAGVFHPTSGITYLP